jgi:hypothetical protein
VALGDINGDGAPEIIACGSDRGGFTIYTGDGTGANWTEAPPAGLPTTRDPQEGADDDGGWCREVLLVDMNGDKHLDVVASWHLGPRVWIGDGAGKFTVASTGLPSPIIFGLFQQIGVLDFNRDGRPDIIASHNINGIEVYLQNADGSWTLTPDVLPRLRGGANAVAAGDLDADGDIDVVAGGRLDRMGQYGLFVILGDPRGGWTEVDTPMLEDRQQVVWGIALGDVNGDRRLDILATLGGSMGALQQTPGKPAADAATNVVHPHIQVWLNLPK